MEIRIAEYQDSDDILVWRNDPISRSMFVQSKNIDKQDHNKWFEMTLTNPLITLYVGLVSGQKIGVCRFDLDVERNVAEVSINLNPLYRGKQLSYQLLLASIEKFSSVKQVDLVAKIKKINKASIKCFEKCGFLFKDKNDEYNYYRKSMTKLSFKFIANACGIFIGKDGTRILCDPWLIDGVFEGSWCHFPKLKTTFNDVKDVDAIYVSHIHPDHFDERYFNFEKSTPIIVLDHGPNFLIKKLNALGYINLIKIKDKETITYHEFDLTMFSPFAKHNFHEANVGNLIDSALLISCDGVSALNANDNTPTIEASKILKEKYGPITLAMLNYNAAGPYPSCFDNLSEEEKKGEHNRILERNFTHIKDVLMAMNPTFMLPFAGAYVLGGNLHYKNKYLGTTTWDECANWLNKNNVQPTKVVLLRENDTLNIERGVSNREYEPINLLEMQRYIEEDLSRIQYPYQLESIPDKEQLISDIERASIGMKERMTRFGISSTFSIVLNVFSKRYQIYPMFKAISALEDVGEKLECMLDERLLRNILDRKSHWNNAEIGAHITMWRSPNKYEPDLHIGLQFFHL